MLAHATGSLRFGRITRHLQPEAAIEAVLEFVETHLVELAQRYGHIKPEIGLTNQLLSLLTLHSKDYPFRFLKDWPENPEDGNSPSIDVGVLINDSNGISILANHYQNNESFFAFEAKRLSLHLGKPREREYLVGRVDRGRYKDTGGVERFKKGIHGKRLRSAGIIGYVQDKDYDYWSATINHWVEELATSGDPSPVEWRIEDKLVEEKMGAIARYRSDNKRIAEENIVLFHLWVRIHD